MRRRGLARDIAIWVSASLTLSGCAKKAGSSSSGSSSQGKYLYVASGACQAGTNTTFTTATSSNIVYRVDAETGNRDLTVADYNRIAGESPVGMIDFDADHLLIAIEKTGARRIEMVEKKLDGARSNFSTDTSALANTLLDMTKSKGGGVFVSRTNGIASISSAGITQSSSYVGTSGGAAACGTTNTKYAALMTTDLGYLVYLNAENNDNKVAVVKGGPTCLAGSTPTPATALMTSVVRVTGQNQLIVANAGNSVATGMNTLMVYDVTEDASTVSLSAPTTIYDAAGFPATYPYLLYAISAMAYDPDGGYLYVASANQVATNIATSGNYVIEKFQYDPVGKSLTKIGSTPFYPSGIDTKCISKLIVGL